MAATGGHQHLTGSEAKTFLSIWRDSDTWNHFLRRLRIKTLYHFCRALCQCVRISYPLCKARCGVWRPNRGGLRGISRRIPLWSDERYHARLYTSELD